MTFVGICLVSAVTSRYEAETERNHNSFGFLFEIFERTVMKIEMIEKNKKGSQRKK